MAIFQALLGLVVFVGLVYLLSADRRRVRWRQVLWGMGLQLGLAFLILRVEVIHSTFRAFAKGVEWVMSFADVGSTMLFGNLARGDLPVAGLDGPGMGVAQVGTVLMLKILPTLIFVSSLMAVLHHFGILQKLVAGLAWLMARTMKVSGAEALASAANVFMGMTEAPLLIRPYLPGMTSSELLAVMVGGFATISGSMMVVYSSQFGVPFEQLLMASVISAPAALYLTKLALPETGTPATLGQGRLVSRSETVNFIDAASNGAAVGLKLALNVGAMLLAFAAGLALVNGVLGKAGLSVGLESLSLGQVLGWVFSPVAWLMGIPWEEAPRVGGLLGTKIALNEFFAYQDLENTDLREHSRTIVTFALCGFANFGSIAIQLGGIGGLAPARRTELARFGIRAMLLGAVANFLTATLMGLLI